MKLSRTNRIVALALALIWIIAGIGAVALGLNGRRWMLLLIGMVAIWYGFVWVRVVREARKLQWSEALRAWRRS